MNNDHTPQALHTLLPPENLTRTRMPAKDVESESSNAVRRRKTKHISRACNPCRVKKTRCNGQRPTCGLCVINNDACSYDTSQDRRRPVSKAYVAALEDRVVWLERMLENKGEAKGTRGIGEGLDESVLDGAGSSSPELPPSRPSGAAPQEPVERLQIDDATGEVREYGPTSVFKHLPTTDALVASSAQSGTFLSSTNPTGAGYAPVVSLPDGFNEAMHKEALQAFFTFFNPWCWWVDEKRFRNDMGVTSAEMGGSVRTNIQTPYYGPLLHFAALAIGVMYLDNVSYTNRELISDSFARNAVNFFEDEIETAKLSTVIGLMLLGTHHAGHARPSLGYIYSGAGLRLTRILGLGIDATSWVDAGLISLETKRARDRTWHTAYIQDKLWSAYVGRAPAPNLSHWHMPFPTVDEEEDTGPWSNLDPSKSKPVRTSRMASTFTWTCKLARIIELILTNIYSARKNIYSEKLRNTKYELCVLLEKWYDELPEPLRVSTATLLNQSELRILPHVLVMNIMFHFAVVLLNRPDYCDTSRPLRETLKKRSATISTTATEKCNQASMKILHLAELFDRTFRLRHAPISMTQFVFTAGTIHLLAAANSKSVESDTALVKRCIVVLQSMGQTWKCASQSSDALQRLLKEWHLKLASSNENRATSVGSNALEKATEEPPSATTPQPIDMQTMLQQNPDVVQQLQQLGWAPPRLDSVSNPSSGFSQDLETLLAGPGYTNGEIADPATAQQHVAQDTSINDMSWNMQPSGYTDPSYTSTLPPLQEQSLFDMLINNEGMAPETWFNHTRRFNL